MGGLPCPVDRSVDPLSLLRRILLGCPIRPAAAQFGSSFAMGAVPRTCLPDSVRCSTCRRSCGLVSSDPQTTSYSS